MNRSIEPSSQLREANPSWRHENVSDVQAQEHYLENLQTDALCLVSLHKEENPGKGTPLLNSTNKKEERFSVKDQDRNVILFYDSKAACKRSRGLCSYQAPAQKKRF